MAYSPPYPISYKKTKMQTENQDPLAYLPQNNTNLHVILLSKTGTKPTGTTTKKAFSTQTFTQKASKSRQNSGTHNEMSNYNPPGDFPDVALLIILGGVGWAVAFYISRCAKRKHQETYIKDKWKRAARRVTKTKKGGIVRQSVGYIGKRLKLGANKVGRATRIDADDQKLAKRHSIINFADVTRENLKIEQIKRSKLNRSVISETTVDSDTNSEENPENLGGIVNQKSGKDIDQIQSQISDLEEVLKAEQEARIKKIEGLFEYVIKRNKL